MFVSPVIDPSRRPGKDAARSGTALKCRQNSASWLLPVSPCPPAQSGVCHGGHHFGAYPCRLAVTVKVASATFTITDMATATPEHECRRVRSLSPNPSPRGGGELSESHRDFHDKTRRPPSFLVKDYLSYGAILAPYERQPSGWRPSAKPRPEQDATCCVPDDCIDPKRRALFVSRAVMRGLIEQLRSEAT